jgi:hypothetical protein
MAELFAGDLPDCAAQFGLHAVCAWGHNVCLFIVHLDVVITNVGLIAEVNVGERVNRRSNRQRNHPRQIVPPAPFGCAPSVPRVIPCEDEKWRGK